MWLIGAMVCLLAAPWVQSNCPLAREMDGHIMRCGTIGSCQSADTSEIVKRAGHESDLCKWRYNKCLNIYVLPDRETSKTLRHGSCSFSCKSHHTFLYLVSVHQAALPLTCDSVRLIAAYYSSIDPERMKG